MGSRAERGATKRRAARGGGWRGSWSRGWVSTNICSIRRLSEELFNRRGLPKHLGLLEQGRESVTCQSPRIRLVRLGDPWVYGDGDKRKGGTLQERPKETHLYWVLHVL